jgi:hypothetical protein
MESAERTRRMADSEEQKLARKKARELSYAIRAHNAEFEDKAVSPSSLIIIFSYLLMDSIPENSDFVGQRDETTCARIGGQRLLYHAERCPFGRGVRGTISLYMTFFSFFC